MPSARGNFGKDLALLLVVIVSLVPATARACRVDPALTVAAAEIVRRAGRPRPEDLLRAARAAGSDAPVVHALLLEDDADARRSALRRMERRFAAPLACGEARSEGRSVLLVAPAAGRLDVRADGRLTVHLVDGWRSARLYARAADGELWNDGVHAGRSVEVPDDLRRPVTLQLVAVGPRGPRPVAERVIGGGGAIVEAGTADSGAPLTVRLAELREDAGVGVLRQNRLLGLIAERHAQRVCDRGVVSHLAPDGDPEERLAREGIRARHVGEVISRATNLSRAYGALLDSPSHRSALLDERFTDLGIGQARDDSDQLCLVILLAAWPRPVPWNGRD